MSKEISEKKQVVVIVIIVFIIIIFILIIGKFTFLEVEKRLPNQLKVSSKN